VNAALRDEIVEQVVSEWRAKNGRDNAWEWEDYIDANGVRDLVKRTLDLAERG